MKKNQNKVSKILDLLAEKKSAEAVVKGIEGITEKDVWAAVQQAANAVRLPEESGGSFFNMNIDGSAMPNPGDAGIGIVISGPDGKTVSSISRYIGHATNNIAEYTALIEGLKEALKFCKSLNVRSDSELLIRQLTGVYRVKDPALREKFDAAKELEEKFSSVNYTHVLREYNAEADKLANTAAKRKS